MERKIIARYSIEVFDNGDIEKKRLPLEQTESATKEFKPYIDCNNISVATSQQLLVIKEVVKAFDELDPDLSFESGDEVRMALRRVASYLDVNMITVLNKISRELKDEDGYKLEVDQFADLIHDYLKELYAASQFNLEPIKESECELINTINRSVPGRYKAASHEAIQRFFRNPKIPFLLKNGKTV